MKKLKLMSMILSIVAIFTVLVSCSGEIQFNELVDGNLWESETATLSKATELTDLEGARVNATGGDLVYLTKDEAQIVYNLESGKIVFNEKSADMTLSLGSCDGASFFCVGKEDQATLYDAEGNKLHKATCKPEFSAVCDLVAFDTKCFRAKDGKLTEAFELGGLATLPEMERKIGDFYYTIDGDSVSVYDASCKILAYYDIPSYAHVHATGVLNEGNVLIQYSCEEAEDAEEYDVLIEGKKYSLITLLLNVEDNATEEVEMEYLLTGAVSALDDDWKENLFNDEYSNLAVGYKIEDHRVNQNNTEARLLVLSDDGEVDKVVEKCVISQSNPLPAAWAKNRWRVASDDGRSYLINEYGVTIGEVTGYENRNESYIVAAGKLYNYDLKDVYNYEKEDYEYYGATGSGILFTGKDGELVCYAKDKATTIYVDADQHNVIAVENNYFIILSTASSTPKYELYNAEGTLVISTETMPEVISTLSGGEMLICYYSSNKLIYCRVA